MNTNFNCSVKIVWFEFAKIKGVRMNLQVKSPTFKTAKLKGFTVSQRLHSITSRGKLMGIG